MGIVRTVALGDASCRIGYGRPETFRLTMHCCIGMHIVCTYAMGDAWEMHGDAWEMQDDAKMHDSNSGSGYKHAIIHYLFTP